MTSIMKRIGLAVVVLGVAGITAPARADITIPTDGDFTNWSFGPFRTGGNATAMRLTTGGNPGANIQITDDSTAGLEGASAIKNDFSTSGVSFVGSGFKLSLDVSNGAGAFGNGQQIDLLVEQNGSIYADLLGPTRIGPNPPAYYTVTFDGTYTPSAFTLLSGSGPATPDLSGATTTFFGFGAHNINAPSITQNYDNFSLSPAAVVPEPSSFILVALAVPLGVGYCLRRRKRAA